MHQVTITIGANASNYWAKLGTERNGETYEKVIRQERKSTVNSNMLQALLEAVKALNRPCMLDLYTDSDYLYGALRNGWLSEWQKNSWKTAKGTEVKNRKQWEELAALLAPHSLRLIRTGGK